MLISEPSRAAQFLNLVIKLQVADIVRRDAPSRGATVCVASYLSPAVEGCNFGPLAPIAFAPSPVLDVGPKLNSIQLYIILHQLQQYVVS